MAVVVESRYTDRTGHLGVSGATTENPTTRYNSPFPPKFLSYPPSIDDLDMDRLKSLRTHSYRQLRNSHPENDRNSSDHDRRSLLNYADFIVSIDENQNNGGNNRSSSDEGNVSYERRASSLPTSIADATGDGDGSVKKMSLAVSASGRPERGSEQDPDKKVPSIWRECSYDFLGDSAEDSWEKKALAEKKQQENLERRASNIGSESPADPPSKLIGTFLRKQRESGGNSLDFDLDLDLEDSNFPGWLQGHNAPGRELSALSEACESIKDSPEAEAPSGRFPRLDSTSHPSSPSLSDSVSENSPPNAVLKSQYAQPFVSPPELSPVKLHEPVTNGMSGTKAPYRGSDSHAEAQGVDRLSSGLRARRSSKTLDSADRVSSPPAEEITKSPTTRNSVNFSRLKSRLAEPPLPRENAPNKSGVLGAGRMRSGQLKTQQLRSQQLRSGLIPRTGLLGKVDEEEEDPFKDVDLPDKYKGVKWGWVICLEWVALIVLAGTLICSTVDRYLRTYDLWGLQLWKWVTLALVTVCGRLVSGFVIRIAVFFLERNFLLRKRVLYFVYALRTGVQNCMWLGMVLLAWHLLFDPRVQRATQSLIYITKVLECFLIAAALVVVKTFLVKVLASCFHVGTYFERIRDSLFQQYVLETLSGPPMLEMQQNLTELQAIDDEVAGLRKAGAVAPGLTDSLTSSQKLLDTKKSGVISRGDEKKSGAVMSIEKLNKLNLKNVSAWNMKRLVKLVKHTGVTTLTHNIGDTVYGEAQGQEREINSEHQAKIAAKGIFKNVAKPGRKYIVEDDLARFLEDEELARALPLFDGAVETGKITPQVLKNWVVNVYRERRALALSLSDTKTAVNKLHRIVNCVLTMIVIIIWLLVLGIATTHLLVLLSSQLLLVVFVFGNTCKTIFEAIIFLFVMHPFDVGDRCVIEGNQLVVEEMNILTTVFLGDADVKVSYPNSFLATKPIQNYYRSPEMGDNFDFIVHASTSAEKIAQLKEKIGKYIESKPHHWKSSFNMVVVDLVEMHQLKLSLGLSHTMNYQDMGEIVNRKSDLMWEMKRLFEELGIEYHLPPQEVHIRNLDKPNTTV